MGGTHPYIIPKRCFVFCALPCLDTPHGWKGEMCTRGVPAALFEGGVYLLLGRLRRIWDHGSSTTNLICTAHRGRCRVCCRRISIWYLTLSIREVCSHFLSSLRPEANAFPTKVNTQYSSIIVGLLLLLAPEEDAFWIFISVMDTHLRPYFSSLTTQMEVDSALFSRALEVNDPAIGKKILVDMGRQFFSTTAPFSTLPLAFTR